MTERRPLYIVRAEHLDEARKLGRLTPWERSIDDEHTTPLHIGPGPDCFSCSHRRASDACARLARAGTVEEVIALVEYRDRAQHDPHLLCESYDPDVQVFSTHLTQEWENALSASIEEPRTDRGREARGRSRS